MKINRQYVSELDQFLKEFDMNFTERSYSQIKEFKYAEKIAKLRDNPSQEEEAEKIWEGF